MTIKHLFQAAWPLVFVGMILVGIIIGSILGAIFGD